jgi:hypothetical protein
LAIKAARRAPRVHGMIVSSLAAVSQIDLMKRVFVFIDVLQLDLMDRFQSVVENNMVAEWGDIWAI